MIQKCKLCLLRKELCICSLIPRLEISSFVTLLMHVREREKPTNTGRLVHQCLPGSEIRWRGEMDRTPLNLEGLPQEGKVAWLLTLSDGSVPITPEMVAAEKSPIHLIVPDGTWSQASRLASMLSKTQPWKKVHLISDAPSEYRLRVEHLADGMSTFEAVARCLGVIHGKEVRERMEEIFRIMTDRLLYARGTLPASKVRGGVPGLS